MSAVHLGVAPERHSNDVNYVPRDFGPVIAFETKFQIPVARQAGRQMSTPRPCVTNPFRPIGSICNN